MKKSTSDRERRRELIQAIEKKRESRLITFLTSDRQGALGQIGADAVRPMYSHLRALGFQKVPRIDLFLYSQGGGVDVPWRMVTMFREHCDEFNVLVPYKAYSAATMISLGGDYIVMGKKGELGPIDPILRRTEQGEQTAVGEAISVEDVMAFIAFLKERAGLGDQAALASSVGILIDKLAPWVVGSVYRTHSHIRSAARRLLTSHQNPIEERQIDFIVDSLAEKTYSHGHAIGRVEAEEMGLTIEDIGEELDDLMWQLFEEYEALMNLAHPIDGKGIIPEGEDKYEEPAILACIESESQLNVFRGTLKFQHIRETPPQLNLNLNLGLQFPPNISPDQLPQATQAAINQMLQQLQGQIALMVQEEMKKQAPIKGARGDLFNAAWQDATEEGI